MGLEGSHGLFARYEEVVGNFDLNVARARREVAGQYDKLDSPTIAYLAEKFRVEQLANDEAARWDPDERALYAQVADQVAAHGGVANGPWREAPASRWSVKSRETLEGMLPFFRSLRATGDLDGIVKCWGEEADELLEAADLVVSPKSTEDFAALCRAINDAAISSGEDKLRRLDGEIVETPLEPPMLQESTAPPVMHGHVPLLATYDGYAKARQLSPGVRVEWRRYIQHLIDFLGHDDAARLTASKLRE